MLISLLDPVTFILVFVGTILLIYIAKEVKKTYISIIPLFLHLLMLIVHVIELIIIKDTSLELYTQLKSGLVMDFIFVLISFFGFLWVDDLEVKAYNKKSYNESFQWFWKSIPEKDK